ncbi:MAG TPA: AAA domain-containing protein [Catalimonadaceae bacterium]|nr:AAA domain-containing protein [Catalimonadaceae bacterium]
MGWFSCLFSLVTMGNDIRIFKRKLTNLSSANPMLWMGKAKADVQLDLKLFEETDGSSAWVILESAISDSKKIKLCAVHDPRNGTENKISRKLNRLKKVRKLVLQERGVDDLFIAWPFVLGQWQDGSWVRTPFLFIPVDLLQEQNLWRLKPDIKKAFINPAFLLAYAHYSGKPLEHDLFEKELDLDASDGTSFLTALYNLIQSSGIDVNFNSALFEKQLDAFDPIRKADVPAGFQPGVLKLQPQAVLGLFTLSDSLLIPDFDFLESQDVPIQDIFIKEEIPGGPTVKEKNFFIPLKADGSQEECLQFIRSGKSLVVQGPPGTGKSQLISNLLADAAAGGKTVLLVCQKKVALEVVHRRLTEIGMERHVALWADYKRDLTPVYEQIARQIDDLEDAESRNKSLDTVLIERRFAQNGQDTERIIRHLEEWKAALFDETVAGISWVDLLADEVPSDDSLLTSDCRFGAFRKEEWEPFLFWFERHWDEIKAGRSPETWLAGRSNWLSRGENWFQSIPSKLREVSSILSEQKSRLEKRSFQWSGETITENLARIHSAVEFIRLEYPQGWNDCKEMLNPIPSSQLFSDGTLEILDQEAAEILELLSTLHNWPTGMPFTKPDLELLQQWHFRFEGPAQSGILFAVQSAMNKDAAQYRKIRKLHISAGHPPETLGGRILGVLRLFEIGEKSLVFQTVPFSGPERNSIGDLLQNFRLAIPFLKQLRNWYNLSGQLFPDGPGLSIADLEDTARYFHQTKPEWLSTTSFLTELFPDPVVFSLVLHQPEKLPAWFKENESIILTADHTLMEAPEMWSVMALQLLETEVAGLARTEKIVQVLHGNWVQFRLRELRVKFPVLQYSEALFEKDIHLLQKLIEDRQPVSAELVRIRLEEHSNKDLTRNRLQNRVSYRGLYHQVTKKRMRLPMRTLWESFGEEILKLIPCWLATPESVSATWPMDMRFDIVVFDEASQCFAEKGIPSAFRGKQLVVIGDDKQLPPNQLFSTRWEEETDVDDYYSEHDSFLDLAKQFLPQKMLRGHYRSHYPELIGFSNQHFYQGKLEMIPFPETIGQRPSQLMFTKIDGVWENQQNIQEAKAVAREVVDFFRTNPSESLGIITFNARQQVLIEELADQEASFSGMVLPDSFFVKNIENVQGDERDHIWFSIAYATSESGKVVSQFGSLSQEGGENRLNVAITRARKSVRVFSSFHPGEFPVAATAGKGPVLLKKYLEYVYQCSQSQEAWNAQLLERERFGSLYTFCDEMQGRNPVSLVMQKPQIIQSSQSMKELFGLRPFYLGKLGYEVSYEFRHIRQKL